MPPGKEQVPPKANATSSRTKKPAGASSRKTAPASTKQAQHLLVPPGAHQRRRSTSRSRDDKKDRSVSRDRRAVRQDDKSKPRTTAAEKSAAASSPKDLEDTWAPDELHKSLKGIKDDKKKPRDKDRERDRDKDRDRKRDRGKDDDEKKHRRREKDGEKESKSRDKDRDKDRERRHRDRENGDVDEKKHRDRDKDRDRDEDRDRDRRKRDERKDRDEDDADREKRREERRRRRREGDGDADDDDKRDDRKKESRREDRHRKRDDEDREERKRRHRDEDGERKHRRDRDEDGERKHRRHREENGEDGEKKSRRHRDDDDLRRRHRPDGVRQSHHRNKEEDDDNRDRERRHQRHRDQDDETREQRHRRHREDGEKEHRRERHHRDKNNENGEVIEADKKDKKSESSSKKKEEKKEEEKESGKYVTPPNSPVAHHRKSKHRKSDHIMESRSDCTQNLKESLDMKSTYTLDKPFSASMVRVHSPSDEVTEEAIFTGGRTHKLSSHTHAHVVESAHFVTATSHADDEVGEEEEDEYDYDDDFEDYDEDFEEDDDDDDDDDDEDDVDPSDKVSRDEMDEILKAMNEENDKLMNESRKTQQHEDDSDNSHKRPVTASKRTFINFVSAKQRQISSKVSSRARKRGDDLLKVIDLDFATFDMFDLPPCNEYDMYMRTFGSSDTKQAYIQTNDDNIDRDIQTEEIETKEKWCQHPPEDVRGCGGSAEDDEKQAFESETKPLDTIRLSKFIQKAGQVMSVLIEENHSEVNDAKGAKKSNVCVSEEYVELGLVSKLRGRHAVHSMFSPVQNQLLLTAHGPADESQKIEDDTEQTQDSTTLERASKLFEEFKKFLNPPASDALARKGIICVWNVNEPSSPNKVLVCESLPQCCCFSPTKPSLVFAGMVDGSIAVWDLRESFTMHKLHRNKDQELILRYPTYNTAGVLHYENHLSGVVSIVPIVAPADSASASMEGESDVDAGTSFQLATVDEGAVINLWVVAELTHPDPSGSQSDFGLSPGGKVKLIKSSSITLDSPLRDARLRTTMSAYEMQLLPQDPSHFYVGTDTGCILHGVRYGGKAPPRAYMGEIDTPIDVTALDFSPFTEPVFLAGCSDGSLRLYSIEREKPLVIWPTAADGQCIRWVRWCRSRPSVFYVIDKTSRLYIWDLLMNDAMPLKEEVIAKEKVTSFAVSNDYSATGLGVPGRKPQMAICLESGTMEVHTVTHKFSALMPEEIDQFAEYISRVM